MGRTAPKQLDAALMQTIEDADELGIKLEIVNGLAIWEAPPGIPHQRKVDQIRASIARQSAKARCKCIHLADIGVQFSDGSFKRPDIAVFCNEPETVNEGNTAITVPEAVIEVVSKGFEAKDLEIAPNFYLARGVKDVVVYDPSTLLVLHARRDGTTRQFSPAKITLECGCRLNV